MIMTRGLRFCDSFILENSNNVQLQNDCQQALNARCEHSSKAVRRTTKGGCENLTAYYLLALCQSQSLAVKPVNRWQNALRSRHGARSCGRTLLDAICCQEKVQSGSGI